MAGTNDYIGAIESFKSTVHSIQRASLFDVTIPDFAYGTAPGRMLKFSVKGAPFPAAAVGDVQVNYMGRVVHWYGDRNYGGTWATTVILDGSWNIYNAIYLWNQALNGANRIVSEDINAHRHFKKDAYVTAYSTDGLRSHNVMLKGLWPQDIAELAMDWGTVDTASELTVTWVYDYVVTAPDDNSSIVTGINNANSKTTASAKNNTSSNITDMEGTNNTGGNKYGGNATNIGNNP